MFDKKGKVITSFNSGSDKYHFDNFVQAVLSRAPEKLNADILEGHLSSALCHLGNVSYRLGDLMTGQEAGERLRNDKEGFETYERFSEHLASNKVVIENAKVVRFGRKLGIDPKTRSSSAPTQRSTRF